VGGRRGGRGLTRPPRPRDDAADQGGSGRKEAGGHSAEPALPAARSGLGKLLGGDQLSVGRRSGLAT
jgi:hypothetical protein